MMQAVPNTFLYFSYGSNLLKKRIHINNPSAEFMGIGRLNDHQLDFIKATPNWNGCSATIVPTEGAHVWGAIWRVHNDNLPALDRQEGVDTNWYFAKLVEVVLPEGSTVECRTYEQTINPPVRRRGEPIPNDRLPSKTYMEVILKGAIQCQLPDYYIRKLKEIPHNGKEASSEMLEKLKNILDFHRYNKFWGGPEATMVSTANAHVWGVVWRVNHEDKVSFDDMKGMNMKIYYLRYIDVLTPYLGYIHCATYIQRINPLPMGDNDPIPVERWPSWTYREVMVYGAKEHVFPPFYIEHLQNLKNNGEEGCLRVYCLCVRYGRDDPCKCWVPGRIPRKPLKLEWRQIKVLRDMRKLAQEIMPVKSKIEQVKSVTEQVKTEIEQVKVKTEIKQVKSVTGQVKTEIEQVKVKTEIEQVKSVTEQVKGETEQVKSDTEQVKSDTEQVKSETEQVETEIEQVETETEQVETETEQVKIN